MPVSASAAAGRWVVAVEHPQPAARRRSGRAPGGSHGSVPSWRGSAARAAPHPIPAGAGPPAGQLEQPFQRVQPGQALADGGVGGASRLAGGAAGAAESPGREATDGASAPGATAARRRAGRVAGDQARPCGRSRPSPGQARSKASIVLATVQPCQSPPTRSAAGAGIGDEHLVEEPAAGHLHPADEPRCRAGPCGSGSMRSQRVWASTFVRATSIALLATWPPDVHTFWPLTTQSSPSAASVWSPARSDPALGSLNSWQ